MKTFSLIIAFHFSLALYSQETAKLKQIDSLVKIINSSGFKEQRDTIKQDYSEIGLSMRTYLTMLTDRTELKKYVNNVHSTSQDNGITKQMTATNTFYFDRHQLIKVEETAVEGSKTFEAVWYYENEIPIFFSWKSDKAQERAQQLLILAKTLLKKVEQ